MDKLTEKINSFNISKPMKDSLLKIASAEQLHIQQVCRRLLSKAIIDYVDKMDENKTV